MMRNQWYQSQNESGLLSLKKVIFRQVVQKVLKCPEMALWQVPQGVHF